MRVIYSGKTLGGSSSINGAAWTRGLDAQYDAWSQLLEQSEQNLNWNWASMFSYMKKVRIISSQPNPMSPTNFSYLHSQRHGQALMASSAQRVQIASMHTTVSMVLSRSPSQMPCMAALSNQPLSNRSNPLLALQSAKISTVVDLTASHTPRT